MSIKIDTWDCCAIWELSTPISMKSAVGFPISSYFVVLLLLGLSRSLCCSCCLGISLNFSFESRWCCLSIIEFFGFYWVFLNSWLFDISSILRRWLCFPLYKIILFNDFKLATLIMHRLDNILIPLIDCSIGLFHLIHLRCHLISFQLCRTLHFHCVLQFSIVNWFFLKFIRTAERVYHAWVSG
mgnify:CR=1 FL=1